MLRRGIRALGSADTHETTLALRAGAASRIAEAHVDAAARTAPPGGNPPPTLRDDFDVDAIDAAVVTAVNGAELLNKNMRLCPPRGALDTWRRAMNEVGRRAGRAPEEAADALLDDDERLGETAQSLGGRRGEPTRAPRGVRVGGPERLGGPTRTRWRGSRAVVARVGGARRAPEATDQQ